MTALLLSMLIGCRMEPPLPLPDPVRAEPQVQARMVRMGPVHGFLARPLAPEDGSRSARLELVDRIGEAEQARALAGAENGLVVLVVDPSVDPEAAQRYLDGMPDVGRVERACWREDCADAPGVDARHPETP